MECISPRIASERQQSCPSPASCWWPRGSLTGLQGFSHPVPLKLPRTRSSSSWWQEPQLGAKGWEHTRVARVSRCSANLGRWGSTPGILALDDEEGLPPSCVSVLPWPALEGTGRKAGEKAGFCPVFSFSLGAAASHLPSLPLTCPCVAEHGEGGLLFTEDWAPHPVLPISSATRQRQRAQAFPRAGNAA